MMGRSRELDPSSSIGAYFGSEVRRYRTGAGMSQERLGQLINYTGAMVCMVETNKRTPPRDFAENADEVLETGGALTRLWPLVHRGNFPSWFQGFVAMEESATKLQAYESQTVPGLLQTEEYARAVIGAGRLADTDERVAARMARQRILAAPGTRRFWAVIDEAVLRRPVGGPNVMGDQLKRLADLAVDVRMVLQVLPFSAGAHACMDGALTILSFDEGEDVAWAEGPGSGQLISQPNDVERCQHRYDLVRADALSPSDSVALIHRVMEEMRA
jgi:hypothetical protein